MEILFCLHKIRFLTQKNTGNRTGLDKVFSSCTLWVTVLLLEKKTKTTKLFEIQYYSCKNTLHWKLLLHDRINTLQDLCILVLFCFRIRMLKSNIISGTILPSLYWQSLMMPAFRGQFYSIPSKPFLWKTSIISLKVEHSSKSLHGAVQSIYMTAQFNYREQYVWK